MNPKNSRIPRPIPSPVVPATPQRNDLSTREGRAQESIAVAREFRKVRDRFDLLVAATPEGESDGVEDEMNTDFAALDRLLWDCVSHSTMIADLPAEDLPTTEHAEVRQ